MDSLDFIIHMMPMYLIGIIMILIVYFSGLKDMLRIEKKPLFKFFKILGVLTVFRATTFFLLPEQEWLSNNNIYSLLSVLFVFWEDMVHTVPLLLLKKIINSDSKIFKWFYRFLILIVTLSFGSGHLYQGWPAAIVLSLYIPITLKIGEKRGFGTVMVGHVIYDFITVLTFIIFGWYR